MKKVIILAVCILVGLLITVMFRSYLNQPPINDHALLQINLGKKELTIEIVNTPTSITQGLSNREQIGSDGMLFILPQTTIPTFWMKEMRFDLDLIWLRNNQVVDISRKAVRPESNESLANLAIYSPSTPANMVLEVNAGQADTWEIKIGDKLSFH